MWYPQTFQSAPPFRSTDHPIPGAMAHCTRVDIFLACAAARPLEKAMMICASKASVKERSTKKGSSPVREFVGNFWVEQLGKRIMEEDFVLQLFRAWDSFLRSFGEKTWTTFLSMMSESSSSPQARQLGCCSAATMQPRRKITQIAAKIMASELPKSWSNEVCYGGLTRLTIRDEIW